MSANGQTTRAIRRALKRPEYRYLYLEPKRGTIRYEREWGGRRFRASTRTADPEEALAFKSIYEERRGIGTDAERAARAEVEAPAFAEVAASYPREGTGEAEDGLSAATLRDRRLHLRPDGRA